MTTTTRDAQALTYLATRIREDTHGCGKWDQNGTYAVIAELVGQNLTETIRRVIGHASDPDARTPGAIKRPFVPKVDAPRAGPLRPDEACRNCGRPTHAPTADCDARPPVKTADVSAPVAHLRALREQATAELCSHGVAIANCLDHRKRNDEEPAETPAYLQARRGPETEGAENDE